MSAEMGIALLAVFISGGAIGTAGTLLAQWIMRRFVSAPSAQEQLGGSEVDTLRSEVADLGRHVRNLDARLDFTERLLDGAIPLSPAPPRILESGPTAADARPGEPRSETR
jgi:hypothetical protein